MSETTLAVDLGGTTIRGGVVTAATVACVTEHDAPREDAATALVELVGSLYASAPMATTVGIAVPGPFDYAGGISLIAHKLHSLRGIELRPLLARRVPLPTTFLNDGDAFALGAWVGNRAGRLVGVTIGTGVGAGFVVAGHLADITDGAPKEGEIWNLPFAGGIVEDRLSAGAVQRAYAEAGGAPGTPVQEIAARARDGDAAGHRAFQTLGHDLGAALSEVTATFTPDAVVVGGGIAGAFDLFGPVAAESFAAATGREVPFETSGVAEPALLGAARAALGQQTDPSSST